MSCGSYPDEAVSLRRKATEHRELAALFSGSGMRDSLLEIAAIYEAHAEARESFKAEAAAALRPDSHSGR
jgi:hypothetical protein